MESNNINYKDISIKRNEIKSVLKNNNPIEEHLHVIIVVSNPCLYKKRYFYS
jgi:hypothetical protein